MKIIKQNYKILPDLNTPEHLERAGRLAYQSKSESGSAIKFIGNIIKRGHMPVLDMATVNLELTMRKSVFNEFLKLQGWSEGKYLFFDKIEQCTQSGDIKAVLSGSPRALTEYLNERSSTYLLCQQISGWLYEADPISFDGLTRKTNPSFGKIYINWCDIDKYQDSDWYKKHKHLSAKFVTNRAVTHELVRHRPASYIQESQRYVRYNNEVVFISPEVFMSEPFLTMWRISCEQAEKNYLSLLEHSSPQAARTVLPNSTKTEIIVHTNLLEWEHIGRLRTSKAADPSMRDLMIPFFEDLCDTYKMIDLKTEAYK